MYQRIKLSDTSLDGQPGALPDELAGLDDATVADLSWVGEPLDQTYNGFGYWPVEMTDREFDPATETLTDDIVGRTPLKSRKVVRAQFGKRSLTPEEIAERNPVPDGPTLSDWRVALITMGRFDDVKAAVEAANGSGSVEGKIAYQRFEYANNVYRSELLQLAPVMGFSPAEVDQSLRIAAQVAAGAQG